MDYWSRAELRQTKDAYSGVSRWAGITHAGTVRGMHNPSVQPFRSEQFVVCAGVEGTRRKLFQIMFGRRDGSLYVSFPYYEHTEAL